MRVLADGRVSVVGACGKCEAFALTILGEFIQNTKVTILKGGPRPHSCIFSL